MIDDSNDEFNFPNNSNCKNNLLLTNTQVLSIRKAFVNGSSANIKFSKTQFFKLV